MKTTHTPGPWTYGPCGPDVAILDANGGLVAAIRPQKDTADIDFANAHLIAAAPDLLACFDAVPVPPTDFDTEEGCREYANAVIKRLNLWLDTTCNAAIAKAERKED